MEVEHLVNNDGLKPKQRGYLGCFASAGTGILSLLS